MSDVKIADADGNGKVSITDAVAIVSYILGDGMAGFVAAAADVDGNSDVNAVDASYILEYYAYSSTVKDKPMTMAEFISGHLLGGSVKLIWWD